MIIRQTHTFVMLTLADNQEQHKYFYHSFLQTMLTRQMDIDDVEVKYLMLNQIG